MTTWRLFFLGLLALGTSLASAQYPQALELLNSQSAPVRRDLIGYTYRAYRVESHPALQALIDQVHTRLLATYIGKAICTSILESEPDLIQQHLGMSRRAADLAAASCRKRFLKVEFSFVFGDVVIKPQKTGYDGTSPKRKFVIVVTDRPDLPLDSWTNAFTNETTIFIRNTPEHPELNLKFLTQAFAHELAIYFDSKSWPFGPDWSSIAKYQNLEMAENLTGDSKTAALNPAISTVLSAVRAFKLEREMMRDLMSKGDFSKDSFVYNDNELPFLSWGCSSACLEKYILSQQSWLSQIYQPLLALAPQFRVRRIEELNLAGRTNNDSFDALVKLPVSFLSRLGNSNIDAVDLLMTWDSPERIDDQQVTINTMNSFITSDLAKLRSAKVKYGPLSLIQTDLLSYLSTPLLSDANTSMASGPRPRIRTGGTK